MPEAEKLREKAEKARRLARQMTGPLTATRLIELAQAYLAHAKLLEGGSGS